MRLPDERNGAQEGRRGMVAVPDLEDDRILRNVNVGTTGYRLLLWDTYRADRLNKSILGYAFYAPRSDGPLFSGEDFHCSPCYAVDSDKTLRSLLCFLTLKPGDTDPDYFDEYTAEQMAFAQGEAEEIGFWALDDVDEEEFFFADVAA